MQGLTEFLPVSSSGHLVLAQKLLNLDPPGIVLEVALHLATVVAVLIYFRRRLGDIFRHAAGPGGWLRFVGLIVVASLPAAAVGILYEDRIEALFADEGAVGWSLLFTAAVLLASLLFRRRGRKVSELGWLGALAIGCAQAVAVAPGVSRSAMTIVAGLAVGLAGAEAATFSFLLSVPAVLGAGLLEARKVESFQGNWPALALACAVALAAGLASIYIVIRTAGGRRFGLFGAYCAVVGAATLILIR